MRQETKRHLTTDYMGANQTNECCDWKRRRLRTEYEWGRKNPSHVCTCIRHDFRHENCSTRYVYLGKQGNSIPLDLLKRFVGVLFGPFGVCGSLLSSPKESFFIFTSNVNITIGCIMRTRKTFLRPALAMQQRYDTMDIFRWVRCDGACPRNECASKGIVPFWITADLLSIELQTLDWACAFRVMTTKVGFTVSL